MSLLLLIDGYNVLSPVAPPSRNTDPRWLDRERQQLLGRLTKHLEQEVRGRTCVVFDAANPPPDRPSRFDVNGIEVLFSVGYDEADDLIEEIIAGHHSPKRLAVVSSDHRIQSSATRRGCAIFDSDPWLDDLLDGKARLAIRPLKRGGQGGAESNESKPDSVSSKDAEQWMRDFGFDEN